MSDQKISQLTGGGAATATDEYVIARSGANYKITGANVAAAATSVGTLSSLTVSGATALSRASDNRVLKLERTTTSAGSGFIYANSGDLFGVTDNTLYPFRVEQSAPSDSLIVKSTGRVGIGTASPDAALHVAGAAGSAPRIMLSEGGAQSTLYATRNSDTNSDLHFATEISGTIADRMVIDYSGNLGVGTTSPDTRIQAAATGAVGISARANTSGDPFFRVYLDSTIYGHWFADRTNANVTIGAVANVPLVLVTNNTEHARITSGGLFYLGTTTDIAASGNAMFQMSQSNNNWIHYAQNSATSGNVFGHYIAFSGQAPNNTTSAFLLCGDTGADRLRIRSNGGIANYQANNVDLSDARTKTDITPAASMWDKVAALEIVTYKYNDQTHDDVNVGVIAQQVETVEPVWVDADGFGETPEGEEPLKTVYTKDITFAAIKALQEAMARIEALEARLAVLEA